MVHRASQLVGTVTIPLFSAVCSCHTYMHAWLESKRTGWNGHGDDQGLERPIPPLLLHHEFGGVERRDRGEGKKRDEFLTPNLVTVGGWWCGVGVTRCHCFMHYRRRSGMVRPPSHPELMYCLYDRAR